MAGIREAELPPEMARAQIAAQQAFQAAALEIETGMRMQVLRFAAVMCTCPRHRLPYDATPSGGCLVHGRFLIDYAGRLIG